MRRALHELLGTARSEGDWESMRSVADSLLELDGLDETAMLAQLVALTLLGDRTLALRRYVEFEARLQRRAGRRAGARDAGLGEAAAERRAGRGRRRVPRRRG